MLNIFKMHAWLQDDKVKVQAHFEGLIDSILPIAFQKGYILLLLAVDNVRVPILPYPHKHQQSFKKLFGNGCCQIKMVFICISVMK